MRLRSALGRLVRTLAAAGWFPHLFLVVISGLAYLPRVAGLTFQKDDWYFLYGGFVGGPQFYLDLTLHTRPARGPLYELLFSLFGVHALPYHLVFYLWRLLGGFAALWLFNLLWPEQKRSNLMLSTLFVIYPGFTWWLGAFEFQPYILSLTLLVLSIVFTLKAIGSPALSSRLAWAAAALLTGWAYLALVEFAIGMEIFRLLCVYFFLRRRHPEWRFWELARKTLRADALFWLIPLGFTGWYQLVFENWRRAQQAGIQLGRVFDSALTLPWWIVRLIQSTLNLTVLAWAVPFQESFFLLRLGDMVLGLAVALVVVVLVLGLGLFAGSEDSAPNQERPVDSQNWRYDALWLGLLGAAGAALPIVMTNRQISFEHYSHYALPGSLAGVLFLGGLIYSIFPKTVRLFALAGLIGIATLTHQALAARSVYEEALLRNFWWQVTWRAPSISRDSTLVVLYPEIDYADGDEVAWGPANSIYFPGHQARAPIQLGISATRMTGDAAFNVVTRARDQEVTDLIIKDVTFTYHYDNILLLTQSSPAGCVRAIDGRFPELSTEDPVLALATSSRSNIHNVGTTGESPLPPEALFGNEPSHGWCYYYEKAELARQQGKWPDVVKLAEEAAQAGYHPNDQIEWMPFLQAYAAVGNIQKVKQISTRINTVDAYRRQACLILGSLGDQGYPLKPEMSELIKEAFCQGSQ